MQKKKLRVGFNNSIDNSSLINVWDRVMTFDTKVKDGVSFDFNEDTFNQIIDNFATSKRDKIGSDYEHQTMNAPFNGKAAPNLAYYNSYAVIKDGKVIRFYSKDDSVIAPQDGGRDDGLYAYRCEITPLGEQLIPNYNEISPLFDSDDTNEKGESIGYNISNISFVNVSHQEGTTVGFSKESMQDSELYAMLGCVNESPSPEELKERMKAFMSEKKTKMDAKEDVKVEDKVKDKEDTKVKMDDMTDASPEKMIEELDELSDEEESLEDMQRNLMAEMSRQLAEAKKKIQELQDSQGKQSSEDSAAAFAKKAVAEGRWPADSMSKLVGFAKAGKAEAMISGILPGTFGPVGLSKKIFSGGEPAGVKYSAAEAEVTPSGIRKSGVALSKAMKDYAKSHKIEFSHTSYRAIASAVREEQPELFTRYANDIVL